MEHAADQRTSSHGVQAGSPHVEVGIIDSGIDSTHVDLSANVDCGKARDFVALGPSVSAGTACTDNQFHGTHVAGIVAGAINGVGVVGVAPKVKVVPIKSCDTAGSCYSSATAAGITYAGDAELEVINMSFFVDDDELAASTEIKCMSDPQERAFRVANERALSYTRKKASCPWPRSATPTSTTPPSRRAALSCRAPGVASRERRWPHRMQPVWSH